MGLEQRFSGDEYYYEMEETFLERLGELPALYSAAIIMQLDVLAQEKKETHKKIWIGGWCCCFTKPNVL